MSATIDFVGVPALCPSDDLLLFICCCCCCSTAELAAIVVVGVPAIPPIVEGAAAAEWVGVVGVAFCCCIEFIVGEPAAAAAAAAFAAFILSSICWCWICFWGVERCWSWSIATLAAFMSALSLEVVVVMEAETTGVWLMEVVVAAEVAEEEMGVEVLIIMAVAAERGAAEREVIATIGFWALTCCCIEVGMVDTRICEGCCCCCCWLPVGS